ncbi:MAG TPA: GNAT family N-acyltransferase [Chitinophagales bacterium]|nr:GNAT family N-acyltransferase [Chitinophagales bacterium]
MSLVTKKDIITAIQLDKLGLEFTADLLMQAAGINRLNKLYDRLAGKQGLEFLDAAFEALKVSYKTDAEEMKNIPASGAFIIVSNHPFGLLDGMLLLRVVCEKRPDFKVMANFLLHKIEPVSRYFIYVDPFAGNDVKGKSITGIKAAMQHLSAGCGLGIFPAGEVSTYQSGFRNIKDKEWHGSIVKLVKKAGVPVLPVYFHGTNRLIFHLLGKIHPSLRTAAIPSELLHKKDSVIHIRIGNSIPVDEQKKFESAEVLGKFLRAHVYALGAPLSQRKSFQQRLQSWKRPKKIIPAVEPALLKKEFDSLKGRALVARNNYEVFLAAAGEIPNILREIGRLREVTYRKVGEGTHQSIDLDEYDNYYEHLFLKDSATDSIVGAYRLGKGDEIYSRFGKKGFYTSTLFRYDDAFVPYLKCTLELGRSFVVEEHQKKAFPLFLLWKGIEKYLSTHRQYRYLLGPVSISSSYSELTRSLLIRFIKQYHYDAELARLVHARKGYEVIEDEELVIILDHYAGDLNELDKLISEIEPSHFKVPVLLKKYIRQNARIIGFNLDPKFNNALDGLMILDLKNLPEDTAYKEI